MDLVIGLDSSTTSTKAIAWDVSGRAVAEGRAGVAMSTPSPGAFEQEPEDWRLSAWAALRDVLTRVDASRVAALAISNQRETVGFLDSEGRSIRPAMVWLDERGRPDIDILSEAIGAERLLAVTGKAPDTTPAIYSVHWLKRTEPEAFTRTAHFVDVHGYLVWKLTGERVTSWGSADPHGFFDIAEKQYAEDLLEHFGIELNQLFVPLRPGSIAGVVTAQAAAETGLRAGTPVAIGGGDGQAAGLGTAILEAGRAYLNLGTAAVCGVWGAEARTDRAFRTETSLSGEGCIYELCLRTGSLLTDWTVKRLLGLDDGYDRLEEEAARLAPGADGLVLLPYWLGAMSPYWNPDARGAMVGFMPDHGRGHVYRALMEGVALDMAMGLDAIVAATGCEVSEIVTIGGGARSRLWRTIVADAAGREVTMSDTTEASCLGAGMIAAAAAGWFSDPAAASRGMRGAVRERIAPDAGRRARYVELMDIYKDLHPALRSVFAKLAAFRKGGEA